MDTRTMVHIALVDPRVHEALSLYVRLLTALNGVDMRTPRYRRLLALTEHAWLRCDRRAAR